MYSTRNLDTDKAYCKEIYADEPSKQYRLITTSKSSVLKNYGMYNDFKSTRDVNVAKLLNTPYDIQSCCTLKDVVTEFAIQGLELDMLIVG